MQSDFFPDRELDMLSWSRNFRVRLEVDYAALGVSLEQMQQYVVVQQAFADALAQCTPEHRSKALVARKNAARREMERASRSLARIIGGQLHVNDAQRIELGLAVRPTRVPALPAPQEMPLISVDDVRGNTITLRLTDRESPSSRARPRGVAGAALFVATGDATPSNSRDWTHHGNTSVTSTTITLDALPPNTPVWICARWYSPRGQNGPTCPPVRTYTTHAGPNLGTWRAPNATTEAPTPLTAAA